MPDFQCRRYATTFTLPLPHTGGQNRSKQESDAPERVSHWLPLTRTNSKEQTADKPMMKSLHSAAALSACNNYFSGLSGVSF